MRPLPYETNMNEVVVFNSQKNQNELLILFTFPADQVSPSKRSLAHYLLAQIIGHEGKGSLYQDLKNRGYLLKIEVSEETSYKTLMNGFEIMLNLTEEGVKEYKLVIAGVFKYLKDVLKKRIESFTRFEDFEFFNELKAMSGNGFNYYKIPDAMDNVCELAAELIFSKDITKIIKDTYPDFVVQPIEISYLLELLSHFTLQNSKILISGKNLLSSDTFHHDKSRSEEHLEVWFKTKYMTIHRNDKQINKLISTYNAKNLHLPLPN